MKPFPAFMVLAASALLAAVCHAAASTPSGDWQLTDETKDGIKVFRREIPGNDVVAFRGEGVVDAPLPLIATIIFDCSRGTEWIEDLAESRILRWVNSKEFIEYDHVGTPFIMKDRDFVTHVSMSVDGPHHTMTIEYKSVDDSSAPQTSYVRGEMIHATFILTTTGDPGAKDSKTDVVADIHCDPKGSVPKWIVNFFQKDWPISTFRNLRRQAAKPDIKIDHRFTELFTKGVL